jgi:hypothetical protein
VATGRPELGLIAEEVAEVYPELVEHDAATGRVEAAKAQQAQMTAYKSRMDFLEARVIEQQAELTALKKTSD